MNETRTLAETREAFRAALKARGMSYAAFAREAGCSPSNVSNLLSGRFEHWPISSRLWAAARRLGLEVADA